MTSWGYRALKAAALCSLVFLFITAEAVKGDRHRNVDLAASSVADGSSGSRKLSSQTDSKLHISSLHDSAQPDMINETSISSASYTLRGIKPGLPATCYGQPCSASACYPAALVTVSTHVNYVNVTATVEFSRRYKVGYPNEYCSQAACKLTRPSCHALQIRCLSVPVVFTFCMAQCLSYAYSQGSAL